MKYRIPLAAAAVTAVLLATGLAWANGSDDSSASSSTTSSISRNSTSSSTSTSSTNPTVTTPTATNPVVATTAPRAAARASSTASIPDDTSRTFVIGNAGTVLLGRSGNSLQIIAATPNAGWASEVEVASGREVEGDFRNGALRVKYNFELEDGTVRVRIENRSDNVDGNGVNDDDQRGDDDDNSGPGSGDGDDDSSGSGSGDGDDDDSSGHGGDDHGDDDDDNSGPGSGDGGSDDDH